MPVATEVDDLERQIVRLEEEIRRRKHRTDQLRRDIEVARTNVERCKASSVLCKQNLVRLRTLDVIPMEDYRDMLKLYEDNCDLLIDHQNSVLAKGNELADLLESQLPFLEGALNECKRKLSQWGRIIHLRR